jgi:phage/plasmid-associated DNA primase
MKIVEFLDKTGPLGSTRLMPITVNKSKRCFTIFPQGIMCAKGECICHDDPEMKRLDKHKGATGQKTLENDDKLSLFASWRQMPNWDTLGFDTRFEHSWAVIDVDYFNKDEKLSTDMSFITDNHPWHRSFTKRLPKIWVKLDEKPPKNRMDTKWPGVELLCGQWSYARKENEVFNADKPVLEMSLSDILPQLQFKQIKKQKDIQGQMCLPSTSLVHLEEKSSFEHDTRLHGDLRVVDLIPSTYWDAYEDWSKLLGIMYNTGYTLENAHQMSRKSGKYDPDGVDTKWNTFAGSPYTRAGFGTLMALAKEGDPKAYADIAHTDRLVRGCILNLEKQTTPEPTQHTPEAPAPKNTIDTLEPYDYIDAHRAARDFQHLQGQDWLFHQEERFMFNGFIWQKDTAKGNRFQRALYESMMPAYSQLQNKAALKAVAAEGDARKAAEVEVKLFSAVQAKLTKMSFMQECAGHFDTLAMAKTDEDMEWDTNHDTFYFKNAVFDLRTGKQTQPDKSHHVTITTGFDYIQPSEEQIAKINDLFEKALPLKGERELYMHLLASGLIGRQLAYINIINGSGGNGKSAVHGLMRALCGDYCKELNTATLCNIHKDERNNDLNQINNKRFVIAAEPEDKACLQIGILKNITGNPKINARANYSTNTVVNVTATLFIECNKKPKLDGRMDEAVLRRALDVPFRSTFKDDPDQHHGDHIFKKDLSFVAPEFTTEHRCALFHVLLPYVRKVYDLNMCLDSIVPQSIKDRNLEYMADSDDFKMWLDELYEPVPDDANGTPVQTYIQAKHMYEVYKDTQFDRLSKKQCREHTYKWFCRELQTNLFTKVDFKERIKVDGSDRNRVLIGWRKKPDTPYV